MKAFCRHGNVVRRFRHRETEPIAALIGRLGLAGLWFDRFRGAASYLGFMGIR